MKGLKFGKDLIVCPYCKDTSLDRSESELGFWEINCRNCGRYFFLPDVYFMVMTRGDNEYF